MNGEQRVDFEVARYGLRTFRVMPRTGEDLGFLEWLILESPKPMPEMVLGPVYINDGTLWLNGSCEATCLAHAVQGVYSMLGWNFQLERHQSPHEMCKCGVYGLLSLEELIRQYPGHANKVVTVVAAEGQTIVGTKGFRTQRAEVVAYWCNPRNPGILAMCRNQFREAQHYENKFTMLRNFHLFGTEVEREDYEHGAA